MGNSGADGKPIRKLLAAPALKAGVAVASGLVLAIGAWLAPRRAPTALSVPEERPAPLLEEQVETRQVVRRFRGIQEVAARVRDRSVAIPPAAPRVLTRDDFSEPPGERRVAGFGVFVSANDVLTHANALRGRMSVPLTTADGRSLNAEFAAYEPSTGLVLPSLPAGSSRSAGRTRGW
jgi:hypothetical protein